MGLSMKKVAVMLLVYFTLYSVSVNALINGDITPAIVVSTVSLTIKHQHLLRSSNLWEEYDGNCSAVIVGTKPLTLLTAAHCFKEAKTNSDSHLPELLINNADASGIIEAKLIKIFLHPFEEVEKNVGLDIAILVFNATLEDGVHAISLKQEGRAVDVVLLCGFGLGYDETGLENPRCSQKKTLTTLQDFYQIMPQTYEALDPMLHIKARAQFEYKQEIIKSISTLLAVNRLDSQGNYSVDEPMPTDGDSGGPWLTYEEDGRYRLVAITSYVERFYNKSAYWSFFNRDVPLSDYPYIAYGIRLGDADVQSFLKNAVKQGADIRFK